MFSQYYVDVAEWCSELAHLACWRSRVKLYRSSQGFSFMMGGKFCAKLLKKMCKEDPQERIHAFEIVSKLGKIGENVESLKSRIQELEKEIVLLNLLLDNNITEI
uniref:Uncharacterized protein n=1 Tax=Wuchereria bancrofti TaxID=6293 RepID=A0A1I8EBQ5_WUCBA